jgi:hypothetical protein
MTDAAQDPARQAGGSEELPAGTDDDAGPGSGDPATRDAEDTGEPPGSRDLRAEGFIPL